VWQTQTHTHTQTDRHTTTAYTTLSIASRGKDISFYYHHISFLWKQMEVTSMWYKLTACGRPWCDGNGMMCANSISSWSSFVKSYPLTATVYIQTNRVKQRKQIFLCVMHAIMLLACVCLSICMSVTEDHMISKQCWTPILCVKSVVKISLWNHLTNRNVKYRWDRSELVILTIIRNCAR